MKTSRHALTKVLIHVRQCNPKTKKKKRKKDTFTMIKIITMTRNIELCLLTQLNKKDAIIRFLMNKYSISNSTNQSTNVAIKTTQNKVNPY